VERFSRGLAWSPPRMAIRFLLGRLNCARATMVPLLLLRSPSGGHPAGAPNICPAGAAEGKLLVLLPESTRLLPVCQNLSRRMDEGGAAAGSAQTVKNPVLPHEASSKEEAFLAIHPRSSERGIRFSQVKEGRGK
jgi:hypothetical protein